MKNLRESAFSLSFCMWPAPHDEHNKPLPTLETPKQASKRLLCGRLFLVAFKFFFSIYHTPLKASMKSTKPKRILPTIVFGYEFKVPATRVNSLFVGFTQANPVHAQQIS